MNHPRITIITTPDDIWHKQVNELTDSHVAGMETGWPVAHSVLWQIANEGRIGEVQHMTVYDVVSEATSD